MRLFRCTLALGVFWWFATITSYGQVVVGEVNNPQGLLNFSCSNSIDGATWCGIRDFGVRQQGLELGTGSFLSFQSRNGNNQWGDWAYINGGLVSLTPGKEQGDLDLIWFVDGKPSGVAGQGRMAENLNPAMFPVNDREIDLGRPNQRFHNIFLSGNIELKKEESQCPPGFPSRNNLLGCLQVQVSGSRGYVPIYGWPRD